MHICGLCAVWEGGLVPQGLSAVTNFAVMFDLVVMFAAPLIAGLNFASHGAFARLGKEEACGSLLMRWSTVLHLIAEKFWLGWAWGELDYAHFIALNNKFRFCDILDNAHNLPLHLAAELGALAALLICGGSVWWAIRQKLWAARDDTRQMAWVVMAVILLFRMLEYPLWCGPFQTAFEICFLLLCHQKQLADAESGPVKV